MTAAMHVINRLASDRLGRIADRILVYNNYDLTEGSILLFLFERGATAPFAVLKLGRNKALLSREFENLKRIHDLCPGVCATPNFIDRFDEFHVLCTEPLDAYRPAGRRARLRKLRLVTEKVSMLHRLLQSQESTRSVRADEYMDPFIALYNVDLPADAVRFYNDIANGNVDTVEKMNIRRIPQHGDLYFDNVLIRGKRVYFLDWEDFGDVSLPGYDLFSLALDVLGTDDNDVERMLRSVDGIASRTRAYFRLLEIPAELAGALLAYTLVQQYLRSREQGRTSEKMFRNRLVTFAGDGSLFRRMSEAYCT